MPPEVLLGKLDRLALKMQYVNSGISVKSQKYFRIAVPCSFTGNELMEWITKNLHVTDAEEARHLVNLMCQYGYFFPVFDNKTLAVKDDSSLFRFQIPYFWPSHNGKPDNIEYAIYLTKRLMRTGEKHGLEEHETEAYTKVRELFGHMWEFINTQAEMQLKLFKERKKADKVVMDSQERAFWRLHRPPAGTSTVFEESHANMHKTLKKRTARDWVGEIDRLKLAIRTKPWLKTRKQVETMVTSCEQYAEYDPFISGCQPNNPWITEDPTLWVLNADYVEVPTERRVRRWGNSIQDLIQDPIGRQVLETFLETEFSQENIRFYCAIQDLKYSPRYQVPDKKEAIYAEFLAHGAPCQVNVDSRTLELCHNAMQDLTNPPRYCFSAAEEHIFVLMSKDSYPRFVRSEIYKSVLSGAQQQGSKRIGWKNFLLPGKKYSIAPNVSATAKPSTSPSQNRQHSKEDAVGAGSLSVGSTPRQASFEGPAGGSAVSKKRSIVRMAAEEGSDCLDVVEKLSMPRGSTVVEKE